MQAIRTGKRLLGFSAGQGVWRRVTPGRRGMATLVILATLGLAIFFPFPDYRYATGFLDAADATTIYLPDGARLTEVQVRYGDSVEAGDVLARVDDSEATADVIRKSTELRAATQELDTHHVATSNVDSARKRWLRATSKQKAAEKQLEEAKAALDRTRIKTPHQGRVVPTVAVIDRRNSTLADQTRTVGYDIRDSVGRTVAPESGWCRVAGTEVLVLVLSIDSQDRDLVGRGFPVTALISTQNGTKVETHVDTVAAADHEQAQSRWEQTEFQVTCPLPGRLSDDLLADLGSRCHAVLHLPPKSLFDRFRDAARGWVE